jgi:hypothetical protein
MQPYLQTKLSTEDGSRHGNCFGTCVASLLELDLATVPPFEDMPDGEWFAPFWDLIRAHGYEFAGTFHCHNLDAFPAEDLARRSPGVDGFYIVGGESLRGFQRGHSVIYDGQGNLVMDPHPSGAGIGKLWDIYMIEPIGEDSRVQPESGLLPTTAAGDFG